MNRVERAFAGVQRVRESGGGGGGGEGDGGWGSLVSKRHFHNRRMEIWMGKMEFGYTEGEYTDTVLMLIPSGGGGGV